MITTIIAIGKLVGGLAIGTGVSAVIKPAIKAITPANINKVQKVCVAVAGVFTATAVAGAASKELDKTIDKTVNLVRKVTKRSKKDQIEDAEFIEET